MSAPDSGRRSSSAPSRSGSRSPTPAERSEPRRRSRKLDCSHVILPSLRSFPSLPTPSSCLHSSSKVRECPQWHAFQQACGLRWAACVAGEAMATRSTRRSGVAEFQELPAGGGKKSKKKGKKQSKNAAEAPIGEAPEEKLEQKLQVTQQVYQNQTALAISSLHQVNTQSEISYQGFVPSQQEPRRTRRNNAGGTIAASSILQHSQHQAILTAINTLITHQLFVHLDTAKLQPSTAAQLRRMRERLKGVYQIKEFSTDLRNLFSVFEEQAHADQPIKDSLRGLHRQIQESLQTSVQTSARKRQTPSSAESASRSKSKSTVKHAPPHQKSVKSAAKNMNSSGAEETEGETSPTEARRQRRFAVNPKSRVPLSELQMASLGFNIRRLASQDLAMICYKYCEDEDSREGGIYYKLDLEKLPKETLFGLEADVKAILKQRGLTYEVVKLDSEEDFVIDSDGSEKKQ